MQQQEEGRVKVLGIDAGGTMTDTFLSVLTAGLLSAKHKVTRKTSP